MVYENGKWVFKVQPVSEEGFVTKKFNTYNKRYFFMN